MRALFYAGLLGLALSGCHAKFKKAVPSMPEVRTQILVNNAPWVNLGQADEDDPVSAFINLMQAARSADIAHRLAESVDLVKVNDALLEGIAQTLGEGPPFTLHHEAAPLMELHVMNWGLDVRSLGAPGHFHYALRVRVYDPDGRKVYQNTKRCETLAGRPDTASQVLLRVDNVLQLERMTDEEITEAFAGAAFHCGMGVAQQMRRHAG